MTDRAATYGERRIGARIALSLAAVNSEHRKVLQSLRVTRNKREIMETAAANRNPSAMPGGAPVIVATSSLMLDVLAMARRAAAGTAKVLVTGESGVGKDLIA